MATNPLQNNPPEYDQKTYQSAVTPQSNTALENSTMKAAGGLLSEQYRPETQGAVTRNVQGEDTSAGQMSKIMDSQSDLMRDARTRAAETMNSRGLLNTSMAVGQTQRDMMDAAMEMAKHDASTYLKQGLENQVAKNQEVQNANAYARDLAAGQFETDMGEFANEAALGRDMTKSEFDTTQNIREDVAATDENIRETEAKTGQDIRLDTAQANNQIRVDAQQSVNRMRESLQDYKESLGKAELDAWIASGAEEAMQKAALDGKYADAYSEVMNNEDMTNVEKEERLIEIDELFADLYDSMGYDFNYMQEYSTGYLAITDAVMSLPFQTQGA